MSSDPFADLGMSLGIFAQSLRELADRGKGPVLGSPADKEADGDPYAGTGARIRAGTSSPP